MSEDKYFIPVQQSFKFQNSDDFSSAAAKRNCLVQKFTASLKLLDNNATCQVLDDDLNDYRQTLNNSKIYEERVKNILSKSNTKPSDLESGLEHIDMKSILNVPACFENSIFCKRSENITEEDFDQFKTSLFDAKNEVQKKFASKMQSVVKTSADCRDSIIKGNKSECRVRESDFKTAGDELRKQSLKKNGSSGSLGGGVKRKLGARRGISNKFVSPMLSNHSSNEDLTKSQEDESEVDERLKNIEPRMVELIRSEIMDSGATIDWDDIAGLHYAKTAIQEAVVWPMLRPDIFTGLRRPPKGILLFGPPGTGKTLIGKCVASQSKSTFFSISASSLTSKWVGDGEKMVRALFAVARCHQPAVIFIDEIDSLLSQRSDSEHESSRRIKTEFLVQLDGATTDNDERILVIGATNRPQELDEAARRRFVKRLYIPLPDTKARFQLIHRLMSTERHSLNNQNLTEIAELSAGYSGADMKNLCSEASLGPIRGIDMHKIKNIQAAEVRPVIMDDFKMALNRVKSSVSNKDLDQYLVWNKTYGSGGEI